MKRSPRLFSLLFALSPGVLCADAEDASGIPPPLFRAVRSGDLASLTALLEGGGDANARREDGSTLLMEAVVSGDLAAVRCLLERGAYVNAQNPDGARALTWALHDPQKVKALIERGAEVEFRTGPEQEGFTPLLLAAGYPGGADVVRLLVARGADVNADRAGFAVLANAALRGDFEIVRLLVEAGARVNTPGEYQPLHGAATRGPPAMVRYLLEKGARVDVLAAGLSPVAYAAVYGHTESVRLLTAAGAGVNARSARLGITPLLWSAGMGSAETVGLLLARGADVGAVDRGGHSALYWASRRGDEETVRLLRQAGAPPLRDANAAKPGSPLHAQVPEGGDASRLIGASVAASLPLIQSSSASFSRSRNCFSCHHQALSAMVVALARSRGLPVDDDVAAAQADATRQAFESARALLMNGLGATDDPAPAYALVGFAAENRKADRLTDSLVQYLLVRQEPDGRWDTLGVRPPHDSSDFTATALAVRALGVYGPSGRRAEVRAAIDRAGVWLRTAEPRDTEDRAFQLLGLAWWGTERGVLAARARSLLKEQRQDGGWAQLDTLESDAYATGLALYALHAAGAAPVAADAWRAGVRYLLATQLSDGSWFVRKRAFPLQRHFDADFPHGRSQFISMAGTCWATMALVLASAPALR